MTHREVDPSSVGMMEGAFFVSRSELLDWVNSSFDLNLSRIEQCASGAVYIQIMDALYNSSNSKVPIQKVKWDAKYDYEFIHNYKLLQKIFTEQQIKKYIEVDKLIKAKYQDNLEFLQWAKAFFERQAPLLDTDLSTYNGLERRKLAGCPLPEWAHEGNSHMSLKNKEAKKYQNSQRLTSQKLQQTSTNEMRKEMSSGNVLSRTSSVTRTECQQHNKRQISRMSELSRKKKEERRHDDASVLKESESPADKIHHLENELQLLRSQLLDNDETGIGMNLLKKNEASSVVNGDVKDNGFETRENANFRATSSDDHKTSNGDDLREWKERCEQAIIEREFYFRKLRRIELLCDERGEKSLTTKEIQEILYALEDDTFENDFQENFLVQE